VGIDLYCVMEKCAKVNKISNICLCDPWYDFVPFDEKIKTINHKGHKGKTQRNTKENKSFKRIVLRDALSPPFGGFRG
jgi:hypothetical protein